MPHGHHSSAQHSQTPDAGGPEYKAGFHKVPASQHKPERKGKRKGKR